MKRISRLLALAALIAILAVPQPALAQTVADGPAIEVFTYGDVPEAKKTRYLATLQSTIVFASGEFGQMPLTLVRLRLYETEELFARGLMDIAGLSEDTAARFARLFVGAAIERDHGIFVRLDPARHRFSSKLIVTDEFLHLLQSSWAGSVHRIRAWLSNGQAFLYSARHVERVAGPHAAGFYRGRAIAAIRERWADLSAISLRQMATSWQWIEAFEKYGTVRGWSISYSYALLAYEYLEQRTSVQAVLDYFARIRDGMDKDEAFQAAFGFSIDEFDTKVWGHIGALVLTYGHIRTVELSYQQGGNETALDAHPERAGAKNIAEVEGQRPVGLKAVEGITWAIGLPRLVTTTG
jgi:hypothetical protein